MELTLQTLNNYPKKNVSWIAKKLGISTLEVSICQHEYLKQFRKV